jgi:hypothetical protein
MYVNYGLTVAQGIATYVLLNFFFKETFDLRIIPIIALYIGIVLINIRFPEYCGFTCSKLFDVKNQYLS